MTGCQPNLYKPSNTRWRSPYKDSPRNQQICCCRTNSAAAVTQATWAPLVLHTSHRSTASTNRCQSCLLQWHKPMHGSTSHVQELPVGSTNAALAQEECCCWHCRLSFGCVLTRRTKASIACGAPSQLLELFPIPISGYCAAAPAACCLIAAASTLADCKASNSRSRRTAATAAARHWVVVEQQHQEACDTIQYRELPPWCSCVSRWGAEVTDGNDSTQPIHDTLSCTLAMQLLLWLTTAASQAADMLPTWQCQAHAAINRCASKGCRSVRGFSDARYSAMKNAARRM